MLGRQRHEERLFYQFRLEDHVPVNHLLRRIDALLDLSFVHPLLAQHYSAIGRPSVDPELMLRMRWVVQADYFACRLSSGDLTGVESRADNQSGYDRARRALLVELV